MVEHLLHDTRRLAFVNEGVLVAILIISIMWLMRCCSLLRLYNGDDDVDDDVMFLSLCVIFKHRSALFARKWVRACKVLKFSTPLNKSLVISLLPSSLSLPSNVTAYEGEKVEMDHFGSLIKYTQFDTSFLLYGAYV